VLRRAARRRAPPREGRLGARARGAARALGEPYRGVILAHFYEGLDAAAIAAQGGTSPATVRSQLARGLAQLRERLVREHGGDRARSLSLFVLAAGREHVTTPPLLELLAMQTAAKLAIGATVIVLTALATRPWDRWNNAPLESEAAGAVALGASVEDITSEPLDDPSRRDGLPTATRAEANVSGGGTATSDSTSVAAPAAPRTVVRAQALGDHDAPLADATLVSAHGNGRPRPGAPSAPSRPDGEVQLALADGELSLHHTTVFPMVFAVRAPGRATRFAGSVVLPDGAPAADVHVVLGDGLGAIEVRTPTDAYGRYFAAPEQVWGRRTGPFTLVAVDPERRYGPSAETVAPLGATDVRLELRPLRTPEVTVTGAAGELLEDALVAPLLPWDLLGPGGCRLPVGEVWTETDAHGRAVLAVPDAEFVVGVSAPGYRMHRSEPLMPERAPTSRAVALEPKPMLRGVVVHGGSQVSGARITVGQRHAEFVPLEAGFPLRMFIAERDVAMSDAEGRFALPIDDAHVEVSVLARSGAREVLSTANRPEEMQFRWNVDVREGVTARCDVDLRDRGTGMLHGRFVIDGAPARRRAGGAWRSSCASPRSAARSCQRRHSTTQGASC